MRCLFVACLLIGVAGPAASHDIYTGLLDPLAGTICCGGHDCFPIGEERVERVNNGWFVQYLGERHFVSAKRALPSPDGKYHICWWGNRVRCFLAPLTM
jgi:hypothetical protein